MALWVLQPQKISSSSTCRRLLLSRSTSIYQYQLDKYKKKKKRNNHLINVSISTRGVGFSFPSVSMTINCRSSSSNSSRGSGGADEDGRGRGDTNKKWNSSSSPSSSPPPPSPYEILGLDSSCSIHELKSAFRRKVKEYHPDVCRDLQESDEMIRCVIQAYELLLNHHKPEAKERECIDPFEEPECEACDLFVDQTVCIGKGCSYSCVEKAPHAFSFNSETGTAFASSQGYAEDYLVQLAVGQCPRRCIHYVTPSQRAVLEETLGSILNSPYDPAEVAYLESLIIQASRQNNRYQQPKSQPKATTDFVDWY